MKKTIFLLFAAVPFVACEKEPDTDKLDNEYLVMTDHDSNFDFGEAVTYYVPDSVLFIDRNDQRSYWTAPEATQIKEQFISNMNERYTRVYNIEEADLGLQLSFVSTTYRFVGYGGSPWWYDYPYYWNPGYWGGYWGDWYYPYLVSYSFTTGSVIAELISLEETVNKKLPVVWDAYISGIIDNRGKVNLNKAVSAINQAFVQSSYLGTK